MGKPQQFKTNNGLEYTSTAFQWFCEANQIYHTTGIPYNPQGQAIVERAHATLKMQLKNLKGEMRYSPQIAKYIKLYTLLIY
jgi:transposase InsO family protein